MATYYTPPPAPPGSGFNSFRYSPSTIPQSSDVAYQAYDPRTLVSTNLNGLMDENGTYIKAARASGTAAAASRGLMNSSIAGGTAENAAINAALPIAQGDAAQYAQINAANQQAKNQYIGEDLAYQGQVDAAGAYASASEFGAQLNYNATMAGQKQQFQEFGMNLGYQYANLGQQGQQFQQQLTQNNNQFEQTLQQNATQFSQTQNTQIGMFQQGMAWNQYQLGYQQQMQNSQNYASMFDNIMQNPNMTADQRQSALNNAQQFFSQQTQYNATLPTFVPYWSSDPGYWTHAWTSG